MKYVFIINPHAGEADNEKKIRHEAESVERCEFYVTKAVDDATEFVRNWCKSHAGFPATPGMTARSAIM